MRILEKLGKRLGGRLYSATVGSGRQQPPIALDRIARNEVVATQGWEKEK